MKLLKREPNKCYLDTDLWVPKGLLNVDGIKHALEYEIVERDTIRVLRLWKESEHHLIVPRAFWNPADMPFTCIDCRPTYYQRTNVRSKILLDYKPGPGGLLHPTGKTVQQDAFSALNHSSCMGGTLQLACGCGKTVVALHFAAHRQVPTLVVVDNTQLLHQWRAEIDRHLILPDGIGLVQGAMRDWKHSIVLATYQTLANWAESMPEEVRRWFGLVIWDEGHHISAPTFSKSAALFYGFRLALTATPTRADGLHVICQHHVGDVIFKHVVQNLPPKIIFRWTGFSLDMEDGSTRADTHDKNGELHLRKLSTYLGKNRERLVRTVLPEVRRLVDVGHKVLVLSYSVNEVINLMALWTRGDTNTPLYTDIPYPSPAEIGEQGEAVGQSPAALRRIKSMLAQLHSNLKRHAGSTKAVTDPIRKRIDKYNAQLEQHRIWALTEKEYRRRQRDYLSRLLQEPSTAGLFTEMVKPPDRMRMLAERQVIFAIMKYGKEGLDDKKLSAVIACEPTSDRNTLQQIMGRPRDKSNAELVFLEDNVGVLIGQCRKLRKHLRRWPSSEGGPFKYSQEDDPSRARTPKTMKPPAWRSPGLSCPAGGQLGTRR